MLSKEGGPSVHDYPAAIQSIATAIGTLDGASDCVSEAHFDNVSAVVGGLSCPISESRAETMHGCLFSKSHADQDRPHRIDRHRTAQRIGWEDPIAFKARHL